MKFHVVAEINGEDNVFIVEADDDFDAQNAVLADMRRSIVMKSCSPWIVIEEENAEDARPDK